MFVVRTRNGERYVLRAYCTGWRSDSDVRYEITALEHLKAKAVSVSYPIHGRDGVQVQHVRPPSPGQDE